MWSTFWYFAFFMEVLLMIRDDIDYKSVIIPADIAREKIQKAIDSFSNKDLDNNLSMLQKLKIHAYVRARFAYCYKYAEDRIYMPDECDPDKVCELLERDRGIDRRDIHAYVYVCCVLRDAINDYYRNLQRFRNDRKSCTEDWKESGMSLEEFEGFYEKESLAPRKILKRRIKLND